MTIQSTGIFLNQPAYALLPTVLDPTKRAFTYDLNGNLTEGTMYQLPKTCEFP